LKGNKGKNIAQEFAKSFYNSKEWKAIRQYIGVKYNWTCAECGGPGEEVHHIIPLSPANIKDYKITFDEDNLVLLCKDCHFLKHEKDNPLNNNNRNRKLTDGGYYFDENGYQQQCKRYLVCGSPASGKSRYVKEHMLEGDLVVDYALIGSALGDCTPETVPFNLLPTTYLVREHIYRMLADGEIDAKNIWILAPLPNQQKRLTLAKRLKAEPIEIHTSYDECIANAMNDKTRKNKELQRKLIEKYFSKRKT
jgi:predicted kinase